MAERPESFVARWSRRKRSPRDTDEATAEPAGDAVTDAPDAGAVAADGAALADPALDDPEAGDPEVVAKLPDIDSLDETSDFKPFLAKGVPEVLRRRALRKLWRLHPVLANLDGLNDYDEDYTLATTALAELKTVYKVGKGMLSDDTPADRAAAAEPAGEEPDSGSEPAPAENATTPPADSPANPLADPLADPPGASPAEGVALAPAADDARPGPAREASEPAELAVAAQDRDAAIEGRAKPTATGRRQAVSRRWGESSR